MEDTLTGREVWLVSRPVGPARPENFEIRRVPVPQPGPGQVLVRNAWMSVDPAMRGRMRGVRTYIDGFALDAPMSGNAVGTVIASADPSVPVGAVVLHQLSWREYALLAASDATVLDPAAGDPADHLGVLGLTGLTAYVALTRIAAVREGSVVFVSGAAGGVGSVAGGIARALGAATVIGSAGGAEKCRLLVEEFGYDHALDYRAGDLAGGLARVAPDGIDVYLDNVGGEHLEAALAALRTGGQVALCGAISQYDATGRQAGPANLALAISKRLTLRGFIVFDHADLRPEYQARAAEWLRSGALVNRKTVVEGIDQAAQAFLDLMAGRNVGKMLVRL
ncbi:NADP-dependent oxidoreductase [Dactylosporangium sp. CA-092794]|uniref:NADP-dependent oxidoreductase n=1 Tax=Dactylosporangium sp. CA-092794 TaxID=3239929 RepID=UPI003D8F5E12